MIQTKLYEILHHLRPTEQKSYLASLSIRENKVSPDDHARCKRYLEQVVKKQLPEYEAEFWSSEGLAPEDAKKVRNRLLRAADRYLVLDTLEREPSLKHILLAKRYSEIGLKKHIRHHLSAARKERPELKEQIIDGNLADFITERIKRINFKKEAERLQEDWESLIAPLSRYYYLTYLRMLLAQYEALQVGAKGEEKKQALRKKIETVIHRSEDEKVATFGRMLRLIDRCEPSEYFEICQGIANAEHPLPLAYQRFMYEFRANYCVWRFQYHEDRRFAREYIEIMAALEKVNGHLYRGGKVSLLVAINCLSTGVVSGNMDWTEAFLARNQKHLDFKKPADRRIFMQFAKGYLDFHRGRLEKAQEWLVTFRNSPVYWQNYSLKLGADRLLMKLYFEQKEEKALLLHLKSVRSYVLKLNQKIPGKFDSILKFFDVLASLSKSGQPLSEEKTQGWPLIDRIWAQRVIRNSPPGL